MRGVSLSSIGLISAYIFYRMAWRQYTYVQGRSFNWASIRLYVWLLNYLPIPASYLIHNHHHHQHHVRASIVNLRPQKVIRPSCW